MMYKNIFLHCCVMFSLRGSYIEKSVNSDKKNDVRLVPINSFNRVVSVPANIYFSNDVDSRLAVIAGERNLINKVYIFLVRDTLYIHFQKMNISIVDNQPITIYLPWAGQKDIALGGNANYCFEEDIAQSDISFELFGNASCRANVNVKNLDLSMRHNSKADLRGAAEKQNLNLTDTAFCNVSQLAGAVKSVTKEKTAQLKK